MPATLTQRLAAAAKRGRLAARARCWAILRCPAAQGKTNLAHFLAFETDMRAKDARAILATSLPEGR